MFIPDFYEKQKQQEYFNKGYEACFNKLKKLVKKLGKRYYKDFIFEIKNISTDLFTFAFTNHKCNCEFCETNIK